MKKKYKQLINWFKRLFLTIKPGSNAFKGGAWGLLVISLTLYIIYTVRAYTGLKDSWFLLMQFSMLIAIVLLGFLIRWLLQLVNKVPSFYKLALLVSIPLLFTISFDWQTPIIILVLASICGSAILVIKKTGFQNLTIVKKVITIFGVCIGLGGFISVGIFYNKEGYDIEPITNAALTSEIDIEQIKAVSPAKLGNYKVKTLTYGSGKDVQREEYGANVTIKTDSVNGIPFLDNWEGFGGWFRKKFFGFDSKSLPINARVWYPEGEGPFPLALIVHGNHSMQDFSDTGYEYLGELLASKGIIMASVDENFINGSWSNIFGGLEKENDARGWLLLEHLKVWHEWNKTEGNPFYQKIDTSNLALMGHSRGGEAAAIAAMFNKLPYYPDDATIKFDYNYNIKSIVAIAPVDGQYEPGQTRTKFEDVNYFVIHGAQDADVSSFMGSQQYERIQFKDSLYHFKSGLYVYGANHGQFNTSWGNNDTGNPFLGLLNLKQLLPAEQQREIAKVYIGAFLDVTLKKKLEYLPLFIDARKGKDWLPETIYLNQFEDSNLEVIANFDEDFDVTSSTKKAGKIHTENLSVWREQEIKLKWQKKGSRALFIGWNYDLENEKDSLKIVPDSLVASYRIQNHSPIGIDASSVLVFSMAESKESATPKTGGKWAINNNKNDKNNNTESNNVNANKNKDEDIIDSEDEEEKEEKDTPKEPIDFTIQLTNSLGQNISFPLSKFAPLQRTLEVMILKKGFAKDDKESENIFQTFYFPMKQIQKINPNVKLFDIKELKFIFNNTQSGVVIIDNIGFTKNL